MIEDRVIVLHNRVKRGADFVREWKQQRFHKLLAERLKQVKRNTKAINRHWFEIGVNRQAARFVNRMRGKQPAPHLLTLSQRKRLGKFLDGEFSSADEIRDAFHELLPANAKKGLPKYHSNRRDNKDMLTSRGATGELAQMLPAVKRRANPLPTIIRW